MSSLRGKELKKEKERLHGYRYVMVSSHMKIYPMGGYGVSTCEVAYIRGMIFVLCANVQACVRACVCFDGRTLPSAVWGVRFPGKKKVTKVYGSKLLAIRGRGWVSN